MTKTEAWRASHEFKSELRMLEHNMRMELERQTSRIYSAILIGGSVLFLLFALLVNKGH